MTPTPTSTRTPSPTATATAPPTAAPGELPTRRHLRVFDELYDLVWSNYLYPDFNGVNWRRLGTAYRERVAAGMTDAEFYRAMAELVGSLNDGHSTFEPPASATATNAAIQVQPPGGEEIAHYMDSSNSPVVAWRWAEHGIVFITIRTFWDQNTSLLLQRRLQELGDQGPIAAILIDLRTSRGGSEHSLQGILSLFADGTLGYFTRRDIDRPLVVSGVDVHQSQTVPLVILVGKDTNSYAEILAGTLQSIGRAQLVGTLTSGNVETIWPHEFEDGSRVWIAEEGFRPLNGENWEWTGVVPDVTVPGDWSDRAAGNDPQMASAIQILLDGRE